MNPDEWGTAWFGFGLSAALVLAGGIGLTRSARELAVLTGAGQTWIGAVLVGAATSLPETVSSFGATGAAGSPDLAAGILAGACALNLLQIVPLDLFHRRESAYRAAGSGTLLAAGLSMLPSALMAFVIAADRLQPPGLGRIGYYGPLLIWFYIDSVRRMLPSGSGIAHGADSASRARREDRLAAVGAAFLLSALVAGAGAARLPFAAGEVRRAMGWGEGYAGTFLGAAATTLPELTVTLTAARLGAARLALGNLFGSNLYNIALFSALDPFTPGGPILYRVSRTHALTALAVCAMTATALRGMLHPPKGRILGLVHAPSLGIAGLFLAHWALQYFLQ